MGLRLPFPNCYEGDCLPGGEYAVATLAGPIYTHLGTIPGPPGDALRYVVVCTTLDGFKMAGQGQHTPATWEWIAREGVWKDRGPNYGVRPCIYDGNGSLWIAKDGGPGTPTDGWGFLNGSGQPVRIVPYSTSLDLHEYVWAGPYLLGQSSFDGIDLIDLAGVRRQIEPGDVHTIWGHFSGTTLAVATRKLAKDQNETVLRWIDAREIPQLPLAPRGPVVVVPPVQPPIKPPIPPVEPPMADLHYPFDFDPTGRLTALRQGFPTPLGSRHPEFLVKACKVVGFGAGLLKKDGGTHVTLPNGINVSQDWMVFPNGSGTDFLSDGEGAATVEWGPAQANPGVLVDVAGLFTDPVDPPVDPTDPPTDGDLGQLLATVADHSTRLTKVEARTDGNTLTLNDLLARVTALEHTGGGTVPANVARKGDRVTVSAKLPLLGSVSLHGTIDGGPA